MKCLLVSLQSNAYVTGLKYLSESIRAGGHSVKMLLLPGYLQETLDPAIADFIRDFRPDLIGIGLMSIEFYPAKNLTRLLREEFAIPVIWGGVHSIINPEECLKYADYVCFGEGERAIVSLLNHLKSKSGESISGIPNIMTRRDIESGEIPPTLTENDLDSIPFQTYLPDYFYGLHEGHIINFAQNPRLFRRYALYGGTCHMTITTRGCPFNCSYCANSYLIRVYGKKVKERSVANCIEELCEVKSAPYVLYINFQDDCFFVHSNEWIREFSEVYRKEIQLPFIVRAIPTMLDKEKLFMLKEAGLSMVVMGIQSACDRVNFEIYSRKVHFSSVAKAAEIIHKSKVAPFYELIVDNPYETEEDELHTITSMAGLHKPYIISLAHLTFFPGTPLAERAIKDQITDPEAYLYRYLVKIDKTYINKLLGITPYIPQPVVAYLNRPLARRGWARAGIVHMLDFIIKRSLEPAIFLFVMTRSLNYNIRWTIRTVWGNWRAALSKLVSNYLGKGDMEYDKRLTLARKKMPELFER